MYILNTKQDYLNCLELNPSDTKSRLQNLLDNRFNWFDVAVLATADNAVIDATHRIIGSDELLYQEYKEDSNALMFGLGFTVEEIEGLING